MTECDCICDRCMDFAWFADYVRRNLTIAEVIAVRDCE